MFSCSLSQDYDPYRVVVRDFNSVPPGRVLCIIARDNQHEAEQIGQLICDFFNSFERKDNG